MSDAIVVREAEMGSAHWEEATGFADSRPLDYLFVHADLHLREIGRCRAFSAHREGQLVAVGTAFHPHAGAMFSVAGEDSTALRELATRLVATAEGHFAVICRERDGLAARRATGLTVGDREIHMVLDGLPLRTGACRPRRADASTWERLAGFYAELPGQVFFSDVLRGNPAYYVEEDGRLVAAAICHFVTPRVLHIGGVLTHPDYRRRGCATGIVAALATEARETGRIASLLVRADNDRAVELYEKLGFVRYQIMSFLMGGE